MLKKHVRLLFPVLFAALVLLRLPSLAQPAGADQGLYAYVAQQIARGEHAYRDAWDQKPPAIHYTYALMYGLWPHESVVAAADLLVAITVALLLISLGRHVSDHPSAGQLAAIFFLAFANPAFTRLGGIRTRAQCETFIACAVAASLVAFRYGLSSVTRRARWSILAGGMLLGVAFLYKFNALLYGLIILALAAGWRVGHRRLVSDAGLAALGFTIPVAFIGLLFLNAGAFGDLWQATVAYNMRYSGETYGGVGEFVRYLLSFPIRHARVDALWLLGGAACITLLALSFRAPRVLLAPVWVATACLSIAANGSRGLPQYFVQAAPALALAAGMAAVTAWSSLRPIGRTLLVVITVVAVARVSDVGKVLDYAVYDTSYLAGRVSRESYLARFGGPGEKFSALAVWELGNYLRAETSPSSTVLVFGYSPGALVQSNRRSASRFFWSKPVVAEFGAGIARYGSIGLLADVSTSRPEVVVLERHDEGLDEIDSASYFLGNASLKNWLTSSYYLAGELEDYLLWKRRG